MNLSRILKTGYLAVTLFSNAFAAIATRRQQEHFTVKFAKSETLKDSSVVNNINSQYAKKRMQNISYASNMMASCHGHISDHGFRECTGQLGPVKWSFDVFFVFGLDKLLNKE